LFREKSKPAERSVSRTAVCCSIHVKGSRRENLLEKGHALPTLLVRKSEKILHIFDEDNC
jgi:hypothetical protein